jgi:hypothetical protein
MVQINAAEKASLFQGGDILTHAEQRKTIPPVNRENKSAIENAWKLIE